MFEEAELFDSKLNLGIKKLTIKEYRKITNDEIISDELATELIDSLYELSLVAYVINK
jgi:hypothetical protein